MQRNERQQFKIFAKEECEKSSPLYEYLSYKIAEDDDLITLASNIPLGQPVPNLFFASIQYLLMSTQHPLKDYYASFSTEPKCLELSFPYFKQFVLSNEKALLQLFHSKLVQTNEVRRCAYLYPMMTEIYATHQKPLALIEIGASAGLQLAMDFYNYEYNGKDFIKNSDCDVMIQSENIGIPLPYSIYTKPNIQKRIGLDLNPINVNDPEQLKWLQALIWPEHENRSQLLLTSAKVVNKLNIELIKGDAMANIETICQSIDPTSQIVIYHTHVANQIPKQVKLEFIETLKKISLQRPLYHCYNNLFDANLHQDFIQNGAITSIRVMDKPDGHARTFTWV